MTDNDTLLSFRSFFDYLYKYYNKIDYLFSDPLEFYYKVQGNKEYCSFISSVFAYGRVNLIKKFLCSFFAHYGYEPNNKISKTSLYYRFQSSIDIEIFVSFLFEVYDKYGSIENLFFSLSDNSNDALSSFIALAHEYGLKHNASKGYYFLFPNPKKSSAKRMRMFLRWMIRKDEVDPGIWSKFSKAEIFYPLDTHIMNFAFNNGIIGSKSNSYSNMNKITKFFKKINNEDPVKYDFCISRLGIILSCKYKKNINCKDCIHYNECPF